jgi:hypothetical protein
MKNESTFPGNGKKNVIAQFLLAQIPRKVREICITMGYPTTLTPIGNPLILGVR